MSKDHEGETPDQMEANGVDEDERGVQKVATPVSSAKIRHSLRPSE